MELPRHRLYVKGNIAPQFEDLEIRSKDTLRHFYPLSIVHIVKTGVW